MDHKDNLILLKIKPRYYISSSLPLKWAPGQPSLRYKLRKQVFHIFGSDAYRNKCSYELKLSYMMLLWSILINLLLLKVPQLEPQRKHPVDDSFDSHSAIVAFFAWYDAKLLLTVVVKIFACRRDSKTKRRKLHFSRGHRTGTQFLVEIGNNILLQRPEQGNPGYI